MTEEFFGALRESFASCGRTSEETFSVAGSRISFRAAPRTRHMLDAMRHLPPGYGEPEMSVMVWDSLSGSGFRPAWDWGSGLVRGEVQGTQSDRLRVTFDVGSSTLSAYDRDSRTAYVWTHDARSLPAYELAAPFKTVLHWWAADNNLRLVHAAAVGRAYGGVLIVGRGGSGKSTTAMQCLLAGMGYAGDDYCIVGHKRVWSAYETGKLDERSISALPSLRPLVVNHEELPFEKGILSLRRTFPRSVVESFPLRAIVIPSIGDDVSSVSPASRAEALLAVAPSTIFQLPTAGRESFAWLSRMVASLPCFRLLLGPDPSSVPALLDGVIGPP